MRVLISGAGVAGNTLACFLGRAGISTTLIEREASCLTRGHSIDLDGSAVKIMDILGLLPELKRRNTGEKGTVFETRSGRHAAFFPLVEGATTSPSPTSPFEILRGDLSGLLYDAAREHESVTHILGKTIDQVTSHTERSVSVRLDDGTALEADLLVLADGQWSKLRSASFPKDSITFVDKKAYIAYSTIPGVPDDTAMWRVVHLPRSRVLSLRPDPYGSARAMAMVIPHDAGEKETLHKASRNGPAAQTAVLRSLFANAGWQADRILDGFDKSDDLYFQAIVQVKMSKWSTNRIICLGDTAHAPSPFTGAGTTLAITGAYLLAGELASLQPHDPPSKAFDAYEAKFKPWVEQIQDISSFVPRLFMPETQLGVGVLRAAIWTVGKIVGIPGLVDFLSGGEEAGFELPEYDFHAKQKQELTGAL